MKSIIRGRSYDTENAFLVYGVYETVGSEYREDNIYMNYDGDFFMELVRIRNIENWQKRISETRLKPISKKGALRKLKSFGFARSNLESLKSLCV